MSAPAAGIVKAGAQGTVLVRAVHSSRSARRSSSAARKGAREQVATRTVAAASAMAHAGAGELVGLVLRLGSSYAALASSGAGLSARVSVTFSAKGEAALRDVVTVTFKRTLRAVRHTAKSSDHRRSKRSARR